MERTLVLLLAFTAVEGYVGNHIFVNQEVNWEEAQKYCRAKHTDLSFIRSQSDLERILLVSNEKTRDGWIGLQQDPSDLAAWLWSGGSSITFQNWEQGQPDYYKEIEDRGQLTDSGKWNDRSPSSTWNFYCIQITVTVELMSWQEALEHCREHHTDLSSMVFETENLLALREMKPLNIDRVWIGLRYLGDRWLWVNGDPLEYEAWGGVQDHQCPLLKRCGAFTIRGQWENRDCQEKLNFICY
ncbi:macrophage mannose receptor 1-like [Cyclopterus lumpus]|uniref:macrophage mannose receptor 1-like n=1 Tax=Cyclopterus lumpus TaxID=8103 RepID=UPI0014868C8E|nr:macrophage mannose receptor 1-like [Cyclopterus lumpus]